MAVTLDVQCLVKEFSSGRPAVDQVSFQIPTGEITVLLGPSGCGKTTTLRCVAGLEHPTTGQIVIDGQVRCKGFLSRPDIVKSGWFSSLMPYGLT